MHSWLPIYHPLIITSQTSLWWRTSSLKGLILPMSRSRCFLLGHYLPGCQEEPGNPDRVRHSKRNEPSLFCEALCHLIRNIQKDGQNAQKTGDFGLESRDLCHRRTGQKRQQAWVLTRCVSDFCGLPKRSFRFLSNILHKYPNFLANSIVWKSPLLTFPVHLLTLVSMSSIPTIRDQRTVWISLFTNQMSNLFLSLNHNIKTFFPP